jgi:hypothetical protein
MRNPLMPQSNDDESAIYIYFALAIVFLAAFIFLVLAGGS